MSIMPFLQQNLWPFMSGISALGMTTGLVFWFYSKSMCLIWVAKLLLISMMFVWWRDVVRESNSGHNSLIKNLLKCAMLLFIVSEVMFFFSFFWALFSAMMSPTVEVGSMWPPLGIFAINAFHLPLLNTMVLLTSGMTVSWAHYCMFTKNLSGAISSLLLTVLLGVYFTILQMTEYLTLSLTISDGVYGALFFVITGFHGFHVIVGTIFLIVSCIRLYLNQFSSQHHGGFEMAAWYWHFVDVVWLFLFICLYWWAN